MLTTHKGHAKDTKGCEFAYTCYTDKYWMGGEKKAERHYVVYDGKGTGYANQIATADSLKELKQKMGNL